MKVRIYKSISLWLPPVTLALIIFNFSSGTVPKAADDYWVDFVVKKIAHMIFFGFLAVLIFRALRGEGVPRKKALIWAVIIATVYGLSDEFHQSFTQGRESRLRDVGFDLLGAIVATNITYYFLPKLPEEIKIYFSRLNLL